MKKPTNLHEWWDQLPRRKKKKAIPKAEMTWFKGDITKVTMFEVVRTNSTTEIRCWIDGEVAYHKAWDRVLSQAEIDSVYADPYQGLVPLKEQTKDGPAGE